MLWQPYGQDLYCSWMRPSDIADHSVWPQDNLCYLVNSDFVHCQDLNGGPPAPRQAFDHMVNRSSAHFR